MIPSEIFTTYAQFNEDITLAALLGDQEKGFYVDVGANHEEYHSVTKYFYQRGWSGINIEPIPRLIAEFSKRKRDLNLSIAVSNKKSKLTLREYPNHDGLSTLDSSSMKENEAESLPFIEYEVEVDTLKNILTKYKVGQIDFLKVDVEGYEQEVLEGNDWARFRPTVICVEANHRKSQWDAMIKKHGYKRFIFDGLNEYYVSQESWGITEGFAERMALKAHSATRIHNLKLWKEDLKYVKRLEEMTQRQDSLIKSLEAQLDEARNPYKLAKHYAEKLKKKD